MARENPLIAAFNGGEVGAFLVGRSDLDWYSQACQTMQNVAALPEGPGLERSGTRFIAEVKTSTALTLIRRFEFSVQQAYGLEFGGGYIRVLMDRAALVVADTTAAVANGDFAADIASWDDLSSGSGAIAWDSAKAAMKLTESSGAGKAEQTSQRAARERNMWFCSGCAARPAMP